MGTSRLRTTYGAAKPLAAFDQGFVTAGVQGLGHDPAPLVLDHLRAGELVELIAETAFDRPLFWQIN